MLALQTLLTESYAMRSLSRHKVDGVSVPTQDFRISLGDPMYLLVLGNTGRPTAGICVRYSSVYKSGPAEPLPCSYEKPHDPPWIQVDRTGVTW